MSYAGAGFVLLSSDLYSILLVHDSRSNKWGFPKGHREAYDADDLATAKRELLEETGITEDQYFVHNETFKIKKGSGSYIFRYAILNQETQYVKLVPGPSYEIRDVAWVPIRDLVDAVRVVDGNIYLRTWLDDIKMNAVKRSVAVYKLLWKRLQVCCESVSSHDVVTCA